MQKLEMAVRSMPEFNNVISPSEMKIVEQFLGMDSGYVLDFTDESFDDFVSYQIGIEASDARCKLNGKSKAKRMRRILREISTGQQALLLQSFLDYKVKK